MALTVVGVNHRGASLEIRERLAYRASDIPSAIGGLRDEADASEAVLLSTCNRTEVYLVESETDSAPPVWRALSARLGADASGHGYVRRDRETAVHLFR